MTLCVIALSSDLFEKMVPLAVQQAMSIYNQRKDEFVNRQLGTMREATNLCNGYAVFLTPFYDLLVTLQVTFSSHRHVCK